MQSQFSPCSTLAVQFSINMAGVFDIVGEIYFCMDALARSNLSFFVNLVQNMFFSVAG